MLVCLGLSSPGLPLAYMSGITILITVSCNHETWIGSFPMQLREVQHQFWVTGWTLYLICEDLGTWFRLLDSISYLLTSNESSITLDTACSSSIYALHFAVNIIRNGDCDAAIAAGSNLILSPDLQLLSTKLGALSPTSICHTFDNAVDGYSRGEGFGAIYLKKLSDAIIHKDHIRAVIRGTAVNS